MKTHVQNQKFLLDTNTIVQILKNPLFLNMMKTRYNFDQLTITSVNEFETEKITGCDILACLEKVENSIETIIDIEEISKNDKILGTALLTNLPGFIHYPDNLILAHAVIRNQILITCDKNLVDAAKAIDHPVINPSLFGIDSEHAVARISKELINLIQQLKNQFQKQIESSQNTKKIIWSAFS